MKIVAISDTHGNHEKIDIPEEGDVLVHAGDFTDFGKGFDDFITWFEKAPQPHKILLLGNHEWTNIKDRRYGEIHPQRITLLRQDGFPPKTSVTIDGHIFSLPGEAPDADVVVAHAPPDNLSPEGDISVRAGLAIQQPDLFICGHAHAERGVFNHTAQTKYINACCPDGEDPFVETI